MTSILIAVLAYMSIRPYICVDQCRGEHPVIDLFLPILIGVTLKERKIPFPVYSFNRGPKDPSWLKKTPLKDEKFFLFILSVFWKPFQTL